MTIDDSTLNACLLFHRRTLPFYYPVLTFFHVAQQRMLVLTCIAVDRSYLGFGDVARVDTTDALARLVHVQHDARRIFPIVTKDRFEYVHHELHRRVVIVQ